MKKTATAAALKKVALEADSKYEPLKRWPARISTTEFTIVVEGMEDLQTKKYL